MEDSLFSIEDDFSDHSGFDSDAINSETEAELYSRIHYAEDLQSFNSKSVDFQNYEFVEGNDAAFVVSPSSYSLCSQENAQIQVDKKSSLDRQDDSSVEDQKSFITSSLFCKLKQHLKRKSDSEDTSPCKKLKNVNESITCKSSTNILMKTGCSSPAKQSPKKKNSTVIIDSDSDDNDIWTESNLSEKSKFTTNLSSFGDTILLSSSDSECDLPYLLSFRDRHSILKNLSMPNIKVGEKKEGQWHINADDLYRQRKFSRRYHETMDIICANCNKKGHSFKVCPVPKVIKCFICGGTHLGSRCANRLCSNCFQYGHPRRRCSAQPNHLVCGFCSMRGHVSENCQDLWRRYHLTTKPMSIVPGNRFRQDSNMWCWNCGRYGHFGGECEEYRSGNHLSTWPCVVSYNNPEKLLKKRSSSNLSSNFERKKCWEKRKNLNIPPGLSERRNVGIEQRNELNTVGARKRKKKKKKVEGNESKKQPGMPLKNMTKKIVKEKNFERTPKQKGLDQLEGMPESVELLFREELKKRTRNMKRYNRRQMQKKRKQMQKMEMNGQKSTQPIKVGWNKLKQSS